MRLRLLVLPLSALSFRDASPASFLPGSKINSFAAALAYRHHQQANHQQREQHCSENHFETEHVERSILVFIVNDEPE